MSRQATRPRKALIACSVLVAPALLLAGCSSREDEIAERNAQLAEQARTADAKRHATRIADRKTPAPSPKKLARSQSLSDFYGGGEDDEESEGKDARKKDDGEPDFLDPTSDYFDNTYVVPEPAGSDDAGGDSSSVELSSVDSGNADPEA